MRMVAILIALALGACGDTQSGPSQEPAEAPLVLEREALVGLWSFDRSCGNYDLVIEADGRAQYYDISPEGAVTSHAGTWALEDNRVVLTMRRLGAAGEPEGDTLSSTIELGAAVTEDLIGDFAPAGDAPAPISARRCPEEDRD